jgi:hypothetical protein
MKALQIFTIALLGTVSLASAEPPMPMAGPLDIDKLEILLDLDAYQKGQVDRVLQELRNNDAAERKAFLSSGKRPSIEDIEAAIAARQESILFELSTVLSDKQLQKLSVLLDMMRPRPGFGPREPRN